MESHDWLYNITVSKMVPEIKNLRFSVVIFYLFADRVQVFSPTQMSTLSFISAAPLVPFPSVKRPRSLRGVSTTRKRTAVPSRGRVFPACVAASGAWEARNECDTRASGAASSSAPGGSDGSGKVIWETIFGCPTALPTSGTPIGVVHFIGGLGACSAPERFYARLLEGICIEAGVAIVCVPLPAVPGFDHAALAVRAAKAFSPVLTELQARYGQYLPVISSGHSLGARLQIIQHSDAITVQEHPNVAGAVLLSFANGEASAAVAGAQTLRNVISSGAASVVGDALQRAAERVGGSVGVNLREEAARAAAKIEEAGTRAMDALDNMEFVPVAKVLVDNVRESYSIPRTLFVRFSRDTIDNSRDGVIEAMKSRIGERGIIVRELNGTHVTPMTPKFGSDMNATGNISIDKGLENLRDASDKDIQDTIATVAAFVKIICEKANFSSGSGKYTTPRLP